MVSDAVIYFVHQSVRKAFELFITNKHFIIFTFEMRITCNNFYMLYSSKCYFLFFLLAFGFFTFYGLTFYGLTFYCLCFLLFVFLPFIVYVFKQWQPPHQPSQSGASCSAGG